MSGERRDHLVRLLRLVDHLRGSAEGVAIRTLLQSHGVSRRTLERDLAVLAEAGFAVDTLGDPGSTGRRKRIVGETGVPATLKAEQLASAYAALGALRQLAAPALVADFEILVGKLQAQQPMQVTTDVAALDDSQAFVSRSGACPDVKPAVLRRLREAILACRRVRIAYRKEGTAPPRDYAAEPYGFLWGGRNYLVWRGCDDARFRKFALPFIDAVEMEAESFVRDESFDLAAFAADSIGVVRDAPLEVELLVTPAGRARLERWRFHPSQTVEALPDGSAMLRFTATGTDEIVHELFRWGDLIRIRKPASLIDAFQNSLRSSAAALTANATDDSR